MRYGLLLACLAGVACGEVAAPRVILPSDAVRLHPEQLDERGMLAPKRPHFDAMVACSGLSRSYEAIEWYAVPRPTFRVLASEVRGMWDGKDAIYLATEGRNNAGVIRHEILHYLSRRADHPEQLFGRNGRCAEELHHLTR